MLIINMNSQLGNQMFQYALYRKLLRMGKKVKLDLRYYKKNPGHFGLDIFNISLTEATDEEINKIRDEHRRLQDRIRRKISGRRNSIFEEVTSKELLYKPEVFKLKNSYIDGYWQSEKYFKDIRDILLKDFEFPPLYDEKNMDLLNKIDNFMSVSVHIRRGDYANGFPMMPREYYSDSIRYFKEKYNQVFFVVFSNDVSWAKENIKFENGVFVDWNVNKDSYKDMFLMTRCKHNIIANSSFSWWGAWLNINEKKEIIAPSIWFFHQKTPDIYCEGWKIYPVRF